jgi:hypothetical protein
MGHKRHHSGCGFMTIAVVFVCLCVVAGLATLNGQGRYSGLSVLPGDADCDGEISISDAVALVQHIFEYRALPPFCSDSVTIYLDSVLTIKRLVLPVDSTVYAGSYFTASLLQKFLIFKHGQLVDSAAWLYTVLPVSLNRNIPPAESLFLKKD